MSLTAVQHGAAGAAGGSGGGGSASGEVEEEGEEDEQVGELAQRPRRHPKRWLEASSAQVQVRATMIWF